MGLVVCWWKHRKHPSNLASGVPAEWFQAGSTWAHRQEILHLRPLLLHPAYRPWPSFALRQLLFNLALPTFPPPKHFFSAERFRQPLLFQLPFYVRIQDALLPPTLPLLPGALQAPPALLALLQVTLTSIEFQAISSPFLQLLQAIVRPVPPPTILFRISLDRLSIFKFRLVVLIAH